MNNNSAMETETTITANHDNETETKNKDSKFDINRLRLSQNFASNVGVKKALITVPVRKPDRQTFVRVHTNPEYRISAAVLNVKEDQETYLVDPDLCSELPGEIVPTEIFTAITRQDVLFLWPVRLPAEDGRQNGWYQSAFEAAQLAMKSWVKVQANMNLGGYEVYEATGNLPEPEWSDKSFKELLEIAFKDRYIDDIDHVVLKRLRGEI